MMVKPKINHPNKTLCDVIVESVKLQLGVGCKHGRKSSTEGFDCSVLVATVKTSRSRFNLLNSENQGINGCVNTLPLCMTT